MQAVSTCTRAHSSMYYGLLGSLTSESDLVALRRNADPDVVEPFVDIYGVGCHIRPELAHAVRRARVRNRDITEWGTAIFELAIRGELGPLHAR